MQALAGQEEKTLLVESALQSAQEQLSERVAEVVRQEQQARKMESEMRTLKERVNASDEEVEQCRYSHCFAKYYSLNADMFI